MGECICQIRKSMFLIALICVAYFGSYSHGAAAAATAFVGSVTLSSSNKYVFTIKLGTPPQLLNLTLDTDAQTTTISQAAFDFSKSSTFHLLLEDLYADTVTLNSTDGFVPTAAVKLTEIVFRLERKTDDVLALGSGPLAIPAQVSVAGKVAWKFAYCLGGSTASPTPTPIFFGNTSYYFGSGLPQSSDRYPNFDFTPYLKYTPLVLSPRGRHGYAVGVTSVWVDEANGGVAVEVDDVAAIGTESLYTAIVEPAYTHIREAFLRAPVVAGSFQRVDTHHGPLDLCYNFSTGTNGSLRAAPLITFTFAGNVSVALSFDNYMVEVGDTDVYCFGLISAGKEEGSSVIGTFQQQNNLVEFDLQKQRLGITGSLIGFRSTCSNFNFTAA